MKLSIQKIAITSFVFAGLILSGSFVVASPMKVSEEVLIDAIFQRDVRIVGISAQQDDSALVISGQVKRVSRSNKGRVPKGYVGATLYSAEGTILYKSTAPYFPRIIPRTGQMKSDFTLSIPVEVPAGSVVRLNYRYYPHS